MERATASTDAQRKAAKENTRKAKRGGLAKKRSEMIRMLLPTKDKNCSYNKESSAGGINNG